MTVTAKRLHLAELMDLLVARQTSVHYHQERPMRTRFVATVAELLDGLNAPAGIRMDCSETETLLCRLAGLANPSGFRYEDGWGNSHTIWEHLPHYDDPANAMVGALVAFGPQGDDHVARVRYPGRDPVVFSHGGEAGPGFMRLSSLERALPAPRTMLSIVPLLGG